MQVIGTIFTKPNQFGDFNWMISNPEYDNSLFIFNDNEEFHETNRTGMGNAIIRQYNKYNRKLTKPKSAGIPTGTLAGGGYQELNSHVIQNVSGAIEEIKELLNKYQYDSICYSVGPNGKLGTGIFDVNTQVINYIDKEIKALSDLPVINIGLI